MNPSRIRPIVFCFFAVLCAYSFVRFELNHGLTHFIPSEHEAELVELSLELVQSRLSRRMVLSVGGGPHRDEVAQALGDSLASHPEVAWVETGFHEARAQAFFELYFDRRFYLASDDPSREIPKLFEADELVRAADQLKTRLVGSPIRGASQTASEDPLGLFDRILDRVRQVQLAPTGKNGNFASDDGEHAIVFLELTSSPFDSERQKPLLHDLQVEFDRLSALYGGGFVLEQSGVNRISVATERSVRSDIFFVSTVSIICVCGLFLLVYGSFRQLGIVAMVPAAGFLSALAIALSLPDTLHGITLAFGFVLLGVTIDYPIHLLNHHAYRSAQHSVNETVRRLQPSLVWSAATTTLAFLSLALSEFPGLREMGIFAAIGVPVALGFTLYAVPAFLPVAITPSVAQKVLARTFVRIVEGLEARWGLGVGAGGVLCMVLVLGLPQLRWADDPSDLMNPDPAAFAESERVRERVGDFGSGQFAVGLAPDSEAALSLNEEIHARLEEARLAGEVGGVNSIHGFLWSEKRQLENLAAFRQIDQRDARIDSAFQSRGFRPGAFEAFGSAIDTPSREPLRVEDFENSPLDRVLDLLVEMEDGFAVVTHLQEVRSPGSVRARLSDLEGAYLIDQEKIVADVYRSYRESTTWMVGLGSAVAFCVLGFRYRNPLRGFLAVLPAAVGTLGVLGLFGLSGHPVNVIGAVSLLVVLGMGVDYGIFCVDSVGKTGGAVAALSSLVISWLTSVFVFGALALSGQPALQSIGLTASVGISLSLLAAPCVVAMARSSLRASGEGR